MIQSLLAGEIFLLLALLLAKCSVIYLCRRLFTPSMRGCLVLCDITVGICGLWCVGSILAVAIDCPALDLIGFQHSFCPNLVSGCSAYSLGYMSDESRFFDGKQLVLSIQSQKL